MAQLGSLDQSNPNALSLAQQSVNAQNQNTLTQSQIDQLNKLSSSLAHGAFANTPVYSKAEVFGRMAETLAGVLGSARMGAAQRQQMADQGEAQAESQAALTGETSVDNANPVDDGSPSPAPQPGGSVADAVMGFEKPKLGPDGMYHAYPDGKQTSIGYGTKANSEDEAITPEEAKSRFKDEFTKAGTFVYNNFPDAPLGAKQALTSLTYNAGTKWASSGLGDAVRNGDWPTAERLFTQYNHSEGKVLPGLTTRRQAELGWFNSPLGGGGQAQSFAPQNTGQPQNPLAGPVNSPVAPQQGAPMAVPPAPAPPPSLPPRVIPRVNVQRPAPPPSVTSPTPIAAQGGMMQPGVPGYAPGNSVATRPRPVPTVPVQPAGFRPPTMGAPPAASPTQPPAQPATPQAQPPAAPGAPGAPAAPQPAAAQPSPVSSGSFLPGSLSPAQVARARTLAARMIANPNTHDQGMAMMEKLMPQPKQFDNGMQGVGNDLIGYRISAPPTDLRAAVPKVTQVEGGVSGPLGTGLAHAPLSAPGAQVNVPGAGQAGDLVKNIFGSDIGEAVKGATTKDNPIDQLNTFLESKGKQYHEDIKKWLHENVPGLFSQ